MSESSGRMRGVLLSDLVRTSEAVSLASGRRVKIDEIAGLLRRAAPEEIPVAVAFLSGELRQRQIGVGYAALGGLLRPAAGDPSASDPSETGMSATEPADRGRLTASRLAMHRTAAPQRIRAPGR